MDGYFMVKEKVLIKMVGILKGNGRMGKNGTEKDTTKMETSNTRMSMVNKLFGLILLRRRKKEFYLVVFMEGNGDGFNWVMKSMMGNT